MTPPVLYTIFSAISLIVALTVHEFAHAFTADRFGDPTPRANGRVSLNPLRHLDPLGTLMLLIAHFGWGKPVPIDPYNLTKREELLVGLAGPASNFALAIIFALIIRFIPFAPLIIFIQMNLVLGVFNLLPIPPLDGSHIFLNLLPEKSSIEWAGAMDQYGIYLLALLLFLPVGGSNIINLIISPIVNFLFNLLI